MSRGVEELKGRREREICMSRDEKVRERNGEDESRKKRGEKNYV